MGSQDDPGYLLVAPHENAPLVVTFGGIGAVDDAHNIPTFEFKNFFEGLDARINMLYVVDHYDAWYLKGVKDLTDDLTAVGTQIWLCINALQPSKVVTMGLSAGGTAALHFGWNFSADTVLAFSPQTTLDQEYRRLIGEDRWAPEVARLHGANIDLAEDKYHWDRALVYCPEDELRDMAYCDRIRHQAGVEIRPYPGDDHIGVRAMRDSGELEKLILEEIQ